jgi:gliding motility-associated-like protein
MPRIAFIFLFCAFISVVHGQTCTNPGQNPATAFPVCGTNTFTQNSVPLCGNRTLVSPCGAAAGLTDKNPFWYKFTCYTSGTLGFIISPLAGNEDYDWQLYNVTTANNLDEVYTNSALFVTCSWSGTFGNTGASPAGTVNFACEGNTPVFTRMPTILAGNQYLLLVSHFSNGQSGYNLSFGGGTAGITDSLLPRVAKATAACDALNINIKLNKKLRCNSLAANGSDFSINSAGASFIAATGFGCSNGFDMDSIQLTLNNPLPPGNYKIKVQIGTDGNTLFDACSTWVPTDDSLNVTIAAAAPVPMDSLNVAACSPQYVDLIFSSPILCSTVAANGSDFVVTGPSPVSVTSATANCMGTGTQSIRVNFAAPIKMGGNYTISLQNGTDGNTLVNECAQSTAAGSRLTFVVRDSVATAFNYNVMYKPCGAYDSVQFTHAGLNGVNQWSWGFTGGTPGSSSLQNPAVAYAMPGTYNVSLKVSNGFCQDSIMLPITINTAPKDLVAPKLASAIAPCEGNQVLIKLNKKITCNSIAANGSDFSIRPALAPIVGAVGFGCTPGMETDSIILTLGSILPTGTYTILIKNGADGNTLTDQCCRSIPVNDSISNIAVVSHPLVTMDSISKVGCKPQELILVFKEPVRCSSISADGSDFSVTGPTPVSITQAAGNCVNGFTNSIRLTLGAIITRGGTYTVTLKTGTDANTLLNECNAAALPGGSLSVIAGDTVNARFTHTIASSCNAADTVSFFHNGLNGITNWKWDFDNGTSSTLQNPVRLYTTTGNRPVSLTVTNGICTDSTTQTIFIDTDTLNAAFETNPFVCPNETLIILNKSTGRIASYAWDFGDNITSTLPTPLPHSYPIPLSAERIYNVRLTITGSLGCSTDTTVKVRALNNCVIAVPTGFTPNGDGLNDFLYPTNAYKSTNLLFRVYNRFGQLIFEAKTPTQKWDGRYKGEPQTTGAYVWMLSYTETDTGKFISQKGTTVLIR